ncbi:MAG: alanine dehydrogenase [Planctomycetota bacterium]|nr:alanine dehydrogenase [Planctomycetota bacterium]
MIVGIPKEVKDNESRVAIVPAGVDALSTAGHTILVEREAGGESGILDEEFKDAGARIVDGAESIWAEAEMILKVKEPVSSEYPHVRSGQIVFTFFHFAASKELTLAMRESGCTSIAYETIEDKAGRHPLLAPMSEVAGRMAVQEGAKYLESPTKGRGLLLGGVPGVEPAHVVVIGGGIVGTNSAKVAAGLGARVTILDVDLDRLRYLDDIMPKNVVPLFSNAYQIREKVAEADLLIGAVLLTGRKAPILVPREYLKTMKPGAVIIDVAVDQGGCIESTRPTTLSQPIYVVDNVVHYAVTNMPGAVGRTSTYALTNVTFPYALQIADLGLDGATISRPDLVSGINIHRGKIVQKGVAEAFDLPHHTWTEAR